MTPVFWIYFDSIIKRQTNWKHRTAGFFAAFILVGAILVPAFEPKDPLLGQFEMNLGVSKDTANQVDEQSGRVDDLNELPLVQEKMAEAVEEVVVATETEALNAPAPSNSAPVVAVTEIPNTPAMVEAASPKLSGRVVGVVDGDTLKVSLNGVTETVRVIGIDTPETVHPSKPVECFGVEASNQAKALLTDTTVELVTDLSQGERDRFGRRLAYVILANGQDFGEQMIKGGYAYEYTYSGRYDKQAIYKSAQTYASSNQLGLWAAGACTESTVTAPAPQPNTPESCYIKGNISSSGEKIYHIPGQRNYNDTIIEESKGERWFCTESEAVAAGWRAAKR